MTQMTIVRVVSYSSVVGSLFFIQDTKHGTLCELGESGEDSVIESSSPCSSADSISRETDDLAEPSLRQFLCTPLAIFPTLVSLIALA